MNNITDAFRLLRSLNRGDEVELDNGARMFVAKELDLSGRSPILARMPAWELASVHLIEGPGSTPISITVDQQAKKSEELPFIERRVSTVKVLEVNDILYKRIDDLFPTDAARIKNFISKKTKSAPEKVLI